MFFKESFDWRREKDFDDIDVVVNEENKYF